MSTAAPESNVKPVEWDLSHVLPATEGEEFQRMLDAFEEKIRVIEAKRGKLDEEIRTPADMEALVRLLADAEEIGDRLDSYGSLAFAADTTDAAAKSLMNRMDRVITDAENRTLFVSLWWKGLPDERAKALTPEHPEIRYYLEDLRSFRPFTLSEAEERVISVKDITGGVALDRLREILTSSYRFKDPKTGKEINQSELTKYVRDPDPALREAAYEELWRVYGARHNELAYMYEAVVMDWANECLDLRGYPSPISVRNKQNDVPDEAVETLLDVCRQNRDVFQRYFEWKGKRLGLEPMNRYHIYAPLSSAKVNVPYEDARKMVLEVFDDFSPEVGRKARRVFDENHVHVYPGPNKRGGAFCATVTTTLTPYVFLNHTGDLNSVKTLAHEMGHAVHSLLAEDRFPLVSHPPLPLAETASVFAEMLLQRKLSAEADEETRIALLSDSVGEAYATIMRQAYFVLFEKEAHRMIREGASAEELSKKYLEQLREQFGPVHVPEQFQHEWTYIPHIYASPFYCYSYSFGMLLSLALYGRYVEEGESFVPKYLDLLAAGGSRPPEEILAKVGVDMRDPAFWQKGFDVVRGMMDELERSSS